MLPEDDDDQPAKPAATTPDDDAVDKRNKLLIEIWKQAVETQKHFNDMCVKSRQLPISAGTLMQPLTVGPMGVTATSATIDETLAKNSKGSIISSSDF